MVERDAKICGGLIGQGSGRAPHHRRSAKWNYNMTKENNNKSDDWRLQAVSALTKPFRSPWTNHTYPIGTKVGLMAVAKYDKKRNIGIPMPNATAMFLNFSNRSYNQAKMIISDNSKVDIKDDKISFISDIDAIDFVENLCAAIVFAFNSLETFANEVIPDDYIFRISRKDAKCIEEYNKEQIERHLNTDVKYGDVLPEIFGLKSPKNKKIWNEYKNLKNIRDRIIHLKTKDRKSSGPNDDTIWNSLLYKEFPNMAKIAKNLIAYYAIQMENKPSWFGKYPY